MKTNGKKKTLLERLLSWVKVLGIIFICLLILGGISSTLLGHKYVNQVTNTKKTETPKKEEPPKTEVPKKEEAPKTTGSEMKKLSDLKIIDKSVIDFTIENTKGYNDVLDVAITVNEDKKEINITVLVKNDLRVEFANSYSDRLKAIIRARDEAKTQAEDIAKQLGFNAFLADNRYSQPSGDFGGLYKEYKLIINLSNANKSITFSGTKKVSKAEIEWKEV